MSKEADGSFNEEYCKWCYNDGEFFYKSKEDLLDYLVQNMPNPQNLDDATRSKQFDEYLSTLKHWRDKKCAQESFSDKKQYLHKIFTFE